MPVVIIAVLIFLIWYMRNPYKLKQQIFIFDVTGKRHKTLHIDTYIDDYIRNSDNWSSIEQSESNRRQTITRMQKKLDNTNICKAHREKQFVRGTNPDSAYLFQLRRYRSGEPFGSIDTEWATSYDWLTKRRDKLAEINYSTNLRAWNAKNQRELMTPELRRYIMRRDNYTCQICGKYMPDGRDIHIDHIIPIARGGKTIPDNLQVLCSHCNLSKGAKLPSEYVTGKWRF